MGRGDGRDAPPRLHLRRAVCRGGRPGPGDAQGGPAPRAAKRGRQDGVRHVEGQPAGVECGPWGRPGPRLLAPAGQGRLPVGRIPLPGVLFRRQERRLRRHPRDALLRDGEGRERDSAQGLCGRERQGAAVARRRADARHHRERRRRAWLHPRAAQGLESRDVPGAAEAGAAHPGGHTRRLRRAGQFPVAVAIPQGDDPPGRV